ncbi:MAG: sulfurtransferase TusA family protein [Alcanivoracaceae bacterium]
MASDNPAKQPEPPADITLDLCQLRCPMPLLKTRQQLRQMSTGQRLRVLATDPGAKRDIPAWLRQTPHRLVQSVDGDGVMAFTILVGEVG